MANWQNQIGQSVLNAAPQATPLNFAVTNGTNQLTLNWGAVSGSDGYEILKSPSGSFSTDLQIIPVKNANQTSYVDSTVTGGAKCFYRIRTTSGTKQNPQSQRGPESGVVSHTAMSSTSSQTATTKLDQFTTDSSRAGARKGNYGAFKQANTGTLTRVTGAGQKSGAASGASGPAAGTKSSGMKSVASAPTSSGPSGGSSGGGSSPSSTPFSSISSGVNNTAIMQVGNGAQILPNASNPGVIEATEAPWSGLFGDLFAGQYIPFDNTATVGAPATTISQVVNGVLGIGTGVAAATSTSGGLVLTTATVLGTLHSINAIVTAATITTATVQTLVAPTAIITAATIATATIVAMINTTATITTATVQTLIAPAAIITSATVGSIISYGGSTTTKGGVPSILATSFLTAQTSAIINQSLVSTLSSFPKGLWRISFVASQTTAGSVGTVLGGTTGFTITFTNANGDTSTKTTALSSPATGVGTSTADTISGVFCGYAGAATNLTYSFGYTAGTPTSGAFDMAAYAEYLG